MPLNKVLRILILAILGFSLSVTIFFVLAASQSEPVTPQAHGPSKKAKDSDYKNCIILYKYKAIFITTGIKDTLSPEQIIPTISKYRRSVRKNIFNIIVSPDAENDMVLPALDGCTSADLNNYRFLEI